MADEETTQQQQQQQADEPKSRSRSSRRRGGDEPEVERTERGEDEGPSQGAPLATTRPKMAEPGPDVSNADIDLNAVSLDAGHSTYHANPDPNPDDLRPAPGPSTLQVLGVGDEDPVENKFEETR